MRRKVPELTFISKHKPVNFRFESGLNDAQSTSLERNTNSVASYSMEYAPLVKNIHTATNANKQKSDANIFLKEELFLHNVLPEGNFNSNSLNKNCMKISTLISEGIFQITRNDSYLKT